MEVPFSSSFVIFTLRLGRDAYSQVIYSSSFSAIEFSIALQNFVLGTRRDSISNADSADDLMRISREALDETYVEIYYHGNVVAVPSFHFKFHLSC